MSDQNQGTDPSSILRVVTEEDMTPEERLRSENADIIAKAESEHDEIAIYQAPKGFSGIVIVAAPSNPKTFQNFVNQVAKPETDKAVETQNFALNCVVHPDRNAMKAMFAKRPAFALKIAGRAQELCGSETKELGKD